MNIFYNSYHKKNTNVQRKLIKSDNFTYQTIIRLIEKYFITKGKFLDLGCGVGTISFFLAGKGHSGVGFDISSDAIELANSSVSALGLSHQVKFKQKNLQTWMTDAKYDYVICSEVIEHIENDFLLVNKIYNSLTKDGILILSTPLKGAPLFKLGLLGNFDKEVGHLRRYDENILSKMFMRIGFIEIEKIMVEGLFRNSLYTFPLLGKLIRLTKFSVFTRIFNAIDFEFLKIFGPSNIYYVLRK